MHILVFDPRLGGHHLSWLRYVIEDLLSAGHRLTVALDGRGPAMTIYRNHLNDLLGQVSVDSVFDSAGRPKGGNRLAALNIGFTQSGADHAFINNLDEFASSMLRRAALGRLPPGPLKGRLSGVYFRPRFLQNRWWPIGNIPKQAGFARLANAGWFHRICLLDEYLWAEHRQRYPRTGLTFLPDPWSGVFDMSVSAARAKLGIAGDKLVLLHYGIGTRRKGLHLIIRTMLSSARSNHWHLLCAGQVTDDREIVNGLQKLSRQGDATVLNRFVSQEDERACFCATDIVMLPYVRHFGSSGVLALSAAAGKMVIASDEGLIGKRVREHQLGLCFASGNSQELAAAIRSAEKMLRNEPNHYTRAAHHFAQTCSRKKFTTALISIYAS